MTKAFVILLLLLFQRHNVTGLSVCLLLQRHNVTGLSLLYGFPSQCSPCPCPPYLDFTVTFGRRQAGGQTVVLTEREEEGGGGGGGGGGEREREREREREYAPCNSKNNCCNSQFQPYPESPPLVR